jgi:acyl transferase domain-containing protein
LNGDGVCRGLAEALALSYVLGLGPDWRAFFAAVPHRVRRAPNYPFERRRHWVIPAERATAAVEAS